MGFARLFIWVFPRFVRVCVLLEHQIMELIFPAIHHMGYDVVRVKLMEGGKRSTLQVMIERLDGKDITLEDCEAVSHQTSALLDVEGPIKTEYNLEVSSPGIDRPLVKLKDFERVVGHEIKLTTQLPIEGRKRFRGEIKTVNEGNIALNLTDEKTEVEIAFDNVASAKLVLTDKLLKQHNS